LDGENYIKRSLIIFTFRQVYYGDEFKAKRNDSILLAKREMKGSLERLVRRWEDNIFNNLFGNNIRYSYGCFQRVTTRCKRNVKWAPLELLMLNYRYKNEKHDHKTCIYAKLYTFICYYIFTFQHAIHT
jgi:hypothetical protein